jgi:hypothetical protein
MGSAGSHRRCTVPRALCQTVAPSCSRLRELHPQRFVRTHKMIVSSPPLQMDQQLWRLLGRGPGTTRKSRLLHGGSSNSLAQYRPCSIVPRSLIPVRRLCEPPLSRAASPVSRARACVVGSIFSPGQRLVLLPPGPRRMFRPRPATSLQCPKWAVRA